MRFEDLEVWQRAARLSADIYRQLNGLRDFGFRDQVTRAGLSVASNVAEGYERPSGADRARFLHYAMGSCAELRSQLYIGIEAGLIDRPAGSAWIAETREVSSMLHALIRALQR